MHSRIYLLVGACWSGVLALQNVHHRVQRVHRIQMSVTAAFSTSQNQVVEKIKSSIPELALKSDLCWQGTVNGSPARLEAYDAPGQPNVAWLSSLEIDGLASSLTIFCGPLTDVPHLTSRVIINADNTMSFFLDWRPRAYGAYETVRPDGTYPGPDELGRVAFEYSGARTSMEKFYTPDLRSFADGLRAQGSAPSLPPSELELLTRGPLCVDIVLPLNDANVNAVVEARSIAAESWLTWQLDPQHEHRPGAPVNSQYVFDTKARQNLYAALLDLYKAKFNDDGVMLAAKDSGPLDEAYVGGGS